MGTRKANYILPLICSIFLLNACGLFENSDPEPEPIIPGEIIFSMRDETEAQNFQIYTMNLDGTGLQQLTRFQDHEAISPAWSPDGSEIVFTTTLNSTTLGFVIYLMSADGANMRPMKTFFYPSFELIQPGNNPVWSADGHKIAFTWCIDCSLCGLNEEIFVYDFEIDSVIQVTDDPAFDVVPTWIKTGSKIAFVSDRDYPEDRWKNDLYEVDVFGNNLKKITTDGNLGSFVYNPLNHFYLIKSGIEPNDWYSLDVVSLDTIPNPEFITTDLSDFTIHKWSVSGNRLLLSLQENNSIGYYVHDVELDSLINLNIGEGIIGIDIR